MIRNEALWPTACRLFLEDSTANIRTPASRKTYESLLGMLQKAHPGKRTSEFTEADLVAWCSAAAAPATVRNRRKVVIAFFSWATWRGLVERDPSIGLKRLVNPQLHGTKVHTWLSESQVGDLLRSCVDGSVTGERDRVLIMYALFTGLRRFELAASRWRDVDLTAGTLAVVGKGDKPAVLGLPPQLVTVLREWRSQCALGLGRPPAADDPLFPRSRSAMDPEGGQSTTIRWDVPLGPTGIWKAVKVRGRAIGLAALAPHDLRRSFADLLMVQTNDIHKVSKALRHSNTAVTEKYLEGSPRRAVAAGQGFQIAL